MNAGIPQSRIKTVRINHGIHARKTDPGNAAVSVGGLAHLVLTVNLMTAGLAALTLLSYVFVYTPLKRITTLCTLVGAIPGALPPLGGWTAAHGDVAAGGVALFAILFVWQLPHSLAIARFIFAPNASTS